VRKGKENRRETEREVRVKERNQGDKARMKGGEKLGPMYT